MEESSTFLPETNYERIPLDVAVIVVRALTVEPNPGEKYNLKLVSGSYLRRPLLGLLVRNGLCEKGALGYNLSDEEARPIVEQIEKYDSVARIVISLAEQALELTKSPRSMSLEAAVKQVGLAREDL